MAVSPEQQQVYLAIWSKAVDTQMHFNEMSVKSRQFGLAFVAAALGLGIVLLTRGEDYVFSVDVLGGFDLHATVFIVLAGVFALIAVRILDLNVYHKMLRGAVTFGEDFERNYMREIFDLEHGMTQAISHFSRYDDAKVVVEESGKYKYTGTKRRSALDKIKRFYNVASWTLVAAALVLFLSTAHFGHPTHPAGQPAGLDIFGR